ncbi:MAG: WYL domain-containing protein, partial [Anaerovoracaceae bacterium]
NKDIDFTEYFDDVIGVTVPSNKPIEKIRLKIDKTRYNYIESKPIHPTQTVKENNSEYAIIELKLIPNYEFETLLLGFADSIEVIEPQSLRETILARARRIIEKNTNCAVLMHNK